MMVVAVKFYQQCVVDGWSGQEEVGVEEGQEDSKLGQNHVIGLVTPTGRWAKS